MAEKDMYFTVMTIPNDAMRALQAEALAGRLSYDRLTWTRQGLP